MKQSLVFSLALGILAGNAFSATGPCGISGSIKDRIKECKTRRAGFALVTRTAEDKEAYLELKTGLLWGDRLLPEHINYPDAQKACVSNFEKTFNISGLKGKLPTVENFEEASISNFTKAFPVSAYFWTSSPQRDFPNNVWVVHGSTGNYLWGNKDENQAAARCVAQTRKPIPCGLDGNINQRIKDCSDKNETSKMVNGFAAGFALVTRTEKLKEVYQDLKTGVIWGYLLPTAMNHYDAEKACSDNIAGMPVIEGVSWRLPSEKEYISSTKNGFGDVLYELKGASAWTSEIKTSEDHKEYAEFFVYSEYGDAKFGLKERELSGSGKRYYDNNGQRQQSKLPAESYFTRCVAN